jgi:hypothetical protein
LKNNKTYKHKILKFKEKYKLDSKTAHLKYFLLVFARHLNEVSKDYVFKGGNVIWYYINTPRRTVDLDAITLSLKTPEMVLKDFEAACRLNSALGYHVTKHRIVDKTEEIGLKGMRIWIKYDCEKMTNTFYVDIVMNLKTDYCEKNFPPDDIKLPISTLEEVIHNKLHAAFRFGTGNTRMKDYDDLYRIALAKPVLDKEKLKRFLGDMPEKLPNKFIRDLTPAWSEHIKQYPDLPDSLKTVFSTINDFLEKATKK